MFIVTTCARPLLASMFLAGGADAIRNPERLAPAARPVVEKVAGLPGVPQNVSNAVRLNGSVQVAAGTLLALGRLPRLSAAVLAGTLLPVTWAGHRFWEIEDDQERAQQRVHFLKNLSMLGGLLTAAADRHPARH
ncbi:DoxX family protein [Kitasatospora sp. RB6PN24]|uniref:DoxX family protein n=1 Tax=Kitasatospora humi TaxID=2893891 RepID=UPI001E3BDFD1|nr:DoxX family protein [Kitasatospora humi]MCC9307801.1 DoxX family protein [Kitasatospora humi]